MSQSSLTQLVVTAGQFHAAGRLADAQALYESVLLQDPGRPDAQWGLGLIASQTARHADAIRFLKWDSVSKSGNPLLCTALAASLLAIPDPSPPKAAQAAAIAARRALDFDPDFPDAYNNLACALLILGRPQDAIAMFHAALHRRPDYPEAHFNLGRSHYELNDLPAAVAAYQAALAARPNYPAALFNLGFALRDQKNYDAAIDAFRKAADLHPLFDQALHNLGVTLAETGRVREAAAAIRSALDIAPLNMHAHSALMYLLQFHPDCTSQDIAVEAARWDARHALPLLPRNPQYANDRDPDRRLRVGYVSPDFYAHAQCRFTLPLFQNHDHANFEIHLYSSVARPDSITEQIRATADHWHEVRHLSDEALAAKIREDQIDILIDLSMHMENHRLLVFARKPAPIQITWLAYPTCPGLSAIDYRLTDSHLEPPALPDPGFPELPLYIDPLNCPYAPVTETPDITPLPAAANGFLTFGSLNNYRKMSPDVLSLWARTLAAIPNSRLVMLCPLGSHRDDALTMFRVHDVAPDRITLLTHLPGPEYWAAYNHIDIALDPFPYNGITTTCDALFMGVPVLTLPGKTAPSRASAALLSALSLPDWIAPTPDLFIEKARTAAANLPTLALLRTTLRQTMQSSPLMNGKSFARRVESTLRLVWQNWSRNSR